MKKRSRVEKLISELCPNGVKNIELNKILQYEQPTNYLVTSTSYDNSFSLPVLTAGKTFILGYTSENMGICAASKDNPLIIFDDFTTAFKWVDFNFKVKSSAMKILRVQNLNTANIRYVYFAMSCIVNQVSEHSRQWITKYSKFKIPLPPLPVQEEIVRILDSFTQLEAELEAELAARQKQYEYYLNTLFNTYNTQMKQLGELGTFVRGNGLQKKDFTESGIGCIHYGQIYTYYGTFANETKSFISKDFAKKLRKAQKNDIIIATTSENDNDVCKAMAWLGDEIAISGDSVVFNHLQNSKYIAYFFQTRSFFDQKKQFISGTKVKRISSKGLCKIKIPLPPIDEQERIVAILDKFEALVNDISIGLPAELAARRKQYEYYRNTLLTFPTL